MVDNDGRAVHRKRPGIGEAGAVLLLAVVVLAGLAFIADGLYLKTRTFISQIIQERGTVLQQLADER